MMKQFITRLILLAVILIFSNKILTAQPNSVELQDGLGSVISLHNSITSAYIAIPSTITQAYIIEILTIYTGANETYPIDLTLKSGTGILNTITIRPDAGNTGELIVTSIINNPVIKFNDCDFVILDGRPGGAGSSADLKIQNTSTSNAQANTIQLINGATNNLIKYCNSFNATANVSGPANIFFDFSNSNVSGNSNNAISDCNIIGGRTGIRSSGTPANSNNNNTITNCSIYDWGFAGFWHQTGSNNFIIEKCNIYQTTGVNVTNPSGINIQSQESFTFTIRKNKIYDIKSTSTSAGLNIRGIFTQQRPGSGCIINIENNFIALNSDNNNVTTTYGIATGAEVSGTSAPYTLNLYYNTIRIGGTQSGGSSGIVASACIFKNSAVAGIVYNQKNNICINNRTGGVTGAIHTGSAINNIAGTLSIDYNCYFANGTGGVNAVWLLSGYNNISSYKTAAFPSEDHSIFKNVNFVSSNDLHLSGASIGDGNLCAMPLAGISTDIDGNTRDAVFPYKGADENASLLGGTLTLKVSLEACSPAQDTVVVYLKDGNSPYINIDSAKVYLGADGSSVINFCNATNSTNYYIAVYHRNSIQTWSQTGGAIFVSRALNYNFTSGISQAYGSNMVLVGSKYCFFTGDVNQDETIDAADLSNVENDAGTGLTGYNVTDLNCDDIVDASDLSYCDNNATLGASVIKP